MKEIVMNKLQRVALAVASAAAVGAVGLGVTAATANAQPAAASHAAPASSLGRGQVKANERVVEAFLQDVINEHRSEEHTSELQSHLNLVCRLLLEKKKTQNSREPRCVTISNTAAMTIDVQPYEKTIH